MTAAADVIRGAVAQAAGGHPPAAIYVGAAGAGRARVAAALRERVREHFPSAIVVVEDDARIALRGAIPAGPGVTIIAGTGSVAYAENGTRSARAGGDGYALGDDGSAYALGLSALRALARALDGRANETPVARIAGRSFDVRDRDGLLDAVYDDDGRVDVARVASLAAPIVAAARNGDDQARGMIDDAVRQLAQLAIVALERAGIALDGVPIAFAGGLLRDPFVASSLERYLRAALPACRIVDAPAEEAAALAALRAAALLLDGSQQ